MPAVSGLSMPQSAFRGAPRFVILASGVSPQECQADGLLHSITTPLFLGLLGLGVMTTRSADGNKWSCARLRSADTEKWYDVLYFSACSLKHDAACQFFGNIPSPHSLRQAGLAKQDALQERLRRMSETVGRIDVLPHAP